MTPEELVGQLQQALSGKLRSVVLYGSAAAGDFVPGTSNYNVLVVADHLGLAELNALVKPIFQWSRAGHRPPLMFTRGQLEASADVYPIELCDIRQSRKVLCGEDPLANLAIRPDSLRLQLERELRAKILALREGYLLTAGKPKRVTALLASSVAGLLVLMRAALRLFREDVPAAKLEAMQELAKHIVFDPRPLVEAHELKHRRRNLRDVDPQALFESYLNTVEQVVDAVDRHLHPHT
jgi:hypothetical protein